MAVSDRGMEPGETKPGSLRVRSEAGELPELKLVEGDRKLRP